MSYNMVLNQKAQYINGVQHHVLCDYIVMPFMVAGIKSVRTQVMSIALFLAVIPLKVMNAYWSRVSG